MLSLQESTVRGREFLSSDPGETRNYVARQLSPHEMDMGSSNGIHAKLRSFELMPAQIVDIQYGGDVWINPEALESDHLVHAAVSGCSTVWRGKERREIRPDNLYLSSPGAAFKIHMTAECRHVTVKLGANCFEDYLTRELNIPVSRPVVFDADEVQDASMPLAWRQLVACIIQQISDMPALLSNRRLQRQYVMVMVELLLNNCRSNYSDRITLHGNEISPWHVRRARCIIHEMQDENLSIAALAERIGVSVRSLQNGFRQFLGVTPVEYIRSVRLERLHQALLHREGEENVTDLMLECGIVNFGRYANYYRQQYGCRPSETLRARARI